MEDMIPPITTVAKGRWTSAPVPVAKAIGTNPREATKAVIKTGRNRMSDPCRIASSSATPSFRSLSMKEIITIPFNTATPDKAIKPTAAEMDKGIPRIQSKRNPPVRARGIPVKTSKEFFVDPNALNRRKKINVRATGTIIQRRLAAEIKCSN